MNVIIKKATLKDLKSIQELNLKLFEKEHKEYDKSLNLNWTFGTIGKKYYIDRISKDEGCVLIATVDNKIVGYLCGGLTTPKAYRIPQIGAELENTMVLEEYRSKGIGKKLYSAFVKWCKTKKVNKISVKVAAQNILGIKFYKNNNFKEQSIVLETDI